MQITTKTEYAIRALYEISRSDNKCLSIKELCNRQHLPAKYLERIFTRLKQLDVVSSKHGSKGGYVLNESLNSTTLRELMEVLDEDISLVKCNENSESNSYCTGFPCNFYGLWTNLAKKINKYLDSITIEEILIKLAKGEAL